MIKSIGEATALLGQSATAQINALPTPGLDASIKAAHEAADKLVAGARQRCEWVLMAPDGRVWVSNDPIKLVGLMSDSWYQSGRNSPL
jgi:hypothetical protein